MTKTIDCTPHPALFVAWACLQALQAEGIHVEYEGQIIGALAGVLMSAERQGKVVFTDDTTPRYDSSRRATSAELNLGHALQELLSALVDSDLANTVYEGTDPDVVNAGAGLLPAEIAPEWKLRIRRAIDAAESVLGH